MKSSTIWTVVVIVVVVGLLVWANKKGLFSASATVGTPTTSTAKV